MKLAFLMHAAAPAPVEPRPEPEDDQAPISISWHLSSLELQEGLTVKEEYDTVPSDLLDS